MVDLRAKYGDDYYKKIRQKRITPATGTIQNLDEQKRKELSKKGHEARWQQKKEE